MCITLALLCRSWSENKTEQSNAVLQPPASQKNKHTDTSLNMPKGFYHIRLSNGGWYITQVLCSHSDTLTSLTESLIILNGFMVFVLEFRGMNFNIPPPISLYICYCFTKGQVRHTVTPRYCPAFLHKSRFLIEY